MPQLIDISGQVFGRVTVLRRDGLTDEARWRCRCSCGIEFTTGGKKLRNGLTRSCGCYQREAVSAANRKHGMSGTKVFRAFTAMMHRCHSPDSQGYPDYGARGITVCEKWRDNFPAFYADMGDPPDGMTLERRRNNEGYKPSNCVWATAHEQAQNRRSTRLYTIEGQTMSVNEWARTHGLPTGTVHTRLRRGATIHEALGLKES